MEIEEIAGCSDIIGFETELTISVKTGLEPLLYP